eukprot:gene30681-1595_t
MGMPTARPIGGSSPPMGAVPHAASLPLAAAGGLVGPIAGSVDGTIAAVLPVGQPIAGSAPLDATPLAGTPNTPPPEMDDASADRDRRHRATVSRVGVSPMLVIQGVGEFPFAYRAAVSVRLLRPLQSSPCKPSPPRRAPQQSQQPPLSTVAVVPADPPAAATRLPPSPVQSVSTEPPPPQR